LSCTYDAAGRRTSAGGSCARTNLPSVVSTTSYNANNQRTKWGSGKLTYDSNGNLTSGGGNSYTWDARNQLTSITAGKTTIRSFNYDAFTRRYSRALAGGTTGLLYDGANAVQELSGSTPTANLLTGLGVDETFTRTDSAGARNFLADALGSTLALADSSGTVQTSYTYEPFGATTITGSASNSMFEYTGRENDGTGLYYYRARFYSPMFQRFITEDPIGLGAGVNFYAYTLSSPTNFRDPSGMDIAVIENGPTSGNPFGHTAIAVTCEGVYSFGNDYYPGGSLEAYLLREAPRRDTNAYIIHTTPAQDAAASKYLKSKVGKPLGGLLKDNCSTRSNEALDAAGIAPLTPRPGLGMELPNPIDLLDELGITPGSAGARALQECAEVISIPNGATTIPGSLKQFEPQCGN
jgi:RHS repeat-associated protein